LLRRKINSRSWSMKPWAASRLPLRGTASRSLSCARQRRQDDALPRRTSNGFVNAVKVCHPSVAIPSPKFERCATISSEPLPRHQRYGRTVAAGRTFIEGGRLADPSRPIFLVSDFCRVEFAAVVSRRVRMNRLTTETANLALRRFDDWLSRTVQIVRFASEQMALAGQFVRDFTSKLSAPDAIHLAIARHIGATLATLDDRLAEAARRHAVPVMIPD
jgi:predicted nucleic acid-binding protein